MDQGRSACHKRLASVTGQQVDIHIHKLSTEKGNGTVHVRERESE